MSMDNGQTKAGYIPYQPGFEQKDHYCNFVIPAGHPLYGMVSDFYQFDTSPGMNEVCVLPDGCMDILFFYDNSSVTKNLAGFHREKALIPVCQVGSAFGVRFVPGGLANIIREPASQLLGKQLPLSELTGKDILLERMEDSGTFEERVAIMTGYLLKWTGRDFGPADIVRYCTEKMMHFRGNVSIWDLSVDTGYTARYLRNLFYRYIGISPKELCEILQFQASFSYFAYLRKEKREISLCDFAVQAGYYDQSHMNKCYQKMVGCLPRNLLSL